MSASAPEVRSARGFLRQRLKAGTGDISPRHYANAAKELGVGFSGVAAALARLYSGGQNEDYYRELSLEQDLASGGQ